MGSQFNNLRIHAKKILEDSLNKSLSHNCINQITEELFVQHIELELQNLELQNAQENLEYFCKKYTDLYDLAPAAYFTINVNGLITEVNNAGADMLGIQKHLLIGHGFSRYIAPEYMNAYAAYRQSMLNSENVKTCELKLMKRNGPLFYATLQGKKIEEECEGINKLLLMLTDITPYKQDNAYSTKDHSDMIEHAAALNEMTSTMLGELRHPLGVLTNYLTGSIRRLEAPNPDVNEINHALKQSLQQLNRMSDYILHMKNFRYKDNDDRQATCIDEMIKGAIDLIKTEITELPVNIRYRKSKNTPHVLVDKLYIQQVIMSLARNAIEAIRDAEVDEPKVTIEVNQLSEDRIEISIIDNGPGFSANEAHRLFDPSFTTKPYGLGMGLAVSRSIIESHGGNLSADLNPTYGACFKFTLPVSN